MLGFSPRRCSQSCMLLAAILPEVSHDLAALVRQKGATELAAQVPHLGVVDRCRCGDEFCASLCTPGKPEGQYAAGHDCVDLDAAEGMMLMDTVAEKIVHVEILNRQDIRRKLRPFHKKGLLE